MFAALPLAAVALAGAPAVAAPPLAPQSAPSGTSPAPPPAAALDMPEPRPVPRVSLVESRRRRPYYGVRRPFFVPGLRVAVGLGARLAGDRSDRAHFALDALLFARVGLHRGAQQAALFPAFGYTLGAGTITREHLMLAGLGLGFMDRSGALALVPALLYGLAERQRVLGVRTSLVLDLYKAGPVFEIAHQYLHLPAGHRHELRLMLGLDLLRVFKVVD